MKNSYSRAKSWNYLLLFDQKYTKNFTINNHDREVILFKSIPGTFKMAGIGNNLSCHVKEG